MGYSINSRTGVIGATYRKTCHRTQQYFGIISNGEKMGYWRKSWSSFMLKFESRSKKPKWTRLIMIDSQAVKNTCNASVESKGFCHYKCTNGIKRHLAVDTLGFPFFTLSHATTKMNLCFIRLMLKRLSAKTTIT